MKKFNSFLDRRLIVLITSTALSLFMGMFIFYHSQNTNLLYGDGKSRLLIARRVFDSMTPGFTQLGGVWPPFPQLLFLPTAWNDTLFYSGISGFISSLIFGVIAVCFLAKLVFGMTKSKIAVIASITAFLLNPSLLYMVTTPMTELVYIGLLITTAYYIWKWSVTEKFLYLPLAGISVVAASLTRYDGWFLAVFSSLIIVLTTLFKHKPLSEIKGSFILFATVAFSGVVGWLVYNLLIYGNLFRFAFGEGSAASQAVGGISVSLSKGHIVYSTLEYLSAANLNVGIISLLIILTALLLIISVRKFRLLIPFMILSTPFLFNITSLFIGQSELLTKNLPPFSLFNTRFGLPVIPLVALSYGILIGLLRRFKYLVILIFLIALLQFSLLLQSTPIVLKEAIIGESSPKSLERQKLSLWLKGNPVGGLTMISGLENDVLIFDAQLPLKRVIYEGSGKYWKMAENNPSSIAERIIVSPEDRDSIWKMSQENKNFFNSYTLVSSGESFRVYDLTKNNKLEAVQSVPTVETVEKPPVVIPPVETSCDYTIQIGDSLWRIAKNKLGKGSYFTKIIKLNKDTYFDLPTIHPGKKIIIPCT